MIFLKSSGKPAILHRGGTISYDSLLACTRRLAELHRGRHGERVAIMAENSAMWIAAFYSVWRTSSIPVPVDAMATEEEVAYILKDSVPAAIFCSAKTRGCVEKALELAGLEIPLFLLEDVSFPREAEPEDLAFPDADMENAAVIIYTSGTTGSPKGVVLTYKNLYVNLKAVSEEVPIYQPTDRVLVLLPVHHVLPLQGTVIMPLTINATCVLASSMSGPDILDAVCKHKVTMMIGVPRLYILLRDGLMAKIRGSFLARCLFAVSSFFGSLKLSRLLFRTVQKKFGGAFRYMPCGGAALDPKIEKDFRALGFEVLTGYGMSETSPMISFTRPGVHRKGSAGQLLSCNEVRITEDGEITVRGPNVMKEYYKRPEETADVMEDGWLHTGDLGYVDKDNFIFITGRKKEIIVLPNGKNINPDEVEQKLLRHPWVLEAGVLASGDGLQALVLPDFKALRKDGILNIEDALRQKVIAQYNEHASSYKRILKCTIVSESLPRTRLGKIKRHHLPEIAERSARGAAKPEKPAPKTREYAEIRNFLHDHTGLEIHPDDHFELDLSLDSLGKVALQVFLSMTFGIEADEQLLLDNPTPEKLAARLKELSTSISKGKGFKWGELLHSGAAPKTPAASFLHSWMNFWCKLMLKCVFRLKGGGIENIPEGPCIFAPNHQSYLDGFFLSSFMNSRVVRDTFFYAKSDHVKSALMRFIARRHNVVVLNVNNDLKTSIQKLAGILRDGRKIVVFPEGTRTMDGSLGTFKQMFAILSLELNVPVVPVALDGAFKALPRTSFFPRFFSSVKVDFLPPVHPEKGDDYGRIVDRVFRKIQEAVKPGGN